MSRYQVTCVRKPDRNSPLHHITHIGIATTGGREIYPRDTIIGWIRGGQHSFYTSVRGVTADVYVEENPPPPIQPFLRTTADRTMIDNLLHLPEC